ncbi:MAG TPA: flavodoxin family protein [Bacteroidales bacterium]|nr:flavodoxin family protein [Bacteroidales bacterium]
MKIIGFNGSNRKTGNTAKLLENVLNGAVSEGAETKLIHLYDLNYKGCRSCFNCKVKNGTNYGKCSIHDDLEPIFKDIENADAIVLATPIYYRTVSGEMKSFIERLLFPYVTYTTPPITLFPKKIKVGFIYTMNNNETEMKENGIDKHLSVFEMVSQWAFGPIEKLYSFDTFQFPDYSKFVADRFDPIKKAKQRDDAFPFDCKKAFDMGIRMTQK